MRYFDKFTDISYRERILNLFPSEFKKGYELYRKGKLPPDTIGEYYSSWYLLDPESTVKFNFNDCDLPLFINAIPSLIDLDAA